MTGDSTRLFLCNCEGSMDVAPGGLGKALARIAEGGGDAPEISFHRQLCRAELGKFETALTRGAPICVGCTQESALFAEVAQDAGREDLRFANIRETAGWADEGANAAPKMAALLAAAMRPAAPARLREVESDGLCLVIGAGQAAFDAATRLNRTLSVTLLLTDPGDLILPQSMDFPVFSGKVQRASGSLGGFDLIIDGYAALLPSSRGTAEFTMARDGVRTSCSVIFDMSGAAPLFSRPEGRDGYLRADPRDRAAVAEAVFDASDLVGSFEKPIYVRYNAAACAHERSKITGCNKCLDHCPAGAILPDGDGVRVDPGICGGCGNCAAHCPTGAISYAYPERGDLIDQVQLLARAYLAAGGKAPALLLHDGHHGAALIGAVARYGRGLPARVIPWQLHSASGVGHDLIAAALAAGFSQVVVLGDPARAEEFAALQAEAVLAEALIAGFGLMGARVVTLLEADPDAVEAALYALPALAPITRAAPAARGTKREIARAALTALAEAGKPPSPVFALPDTAPYGTVEVDTEACTLCLACVSACPADALRDAPDQLQLRLVEAACVQCGLCAATCPENAIRLSPRMNLAPGAMQPVTLNEDEPAECISCGKPFAAAGMLRAVERTLAGKHRMFASDDAARLLRMCEACRLAELSKGGADPFAIAHPRRTRTSDDYLEADRRGLSIDDFLSDD
ncbi:4Fe-4S ferredoxin [Defluviimonas sp. 20V17]|uniref:4Fe-4S binding domain-containing protein n=1 Tax=Allgaiera indica TaxID=765699 RepID=A0AAN4US19_9RHOB|nr:4Fe-4S dicluster domain-containing protein [Allgaiera indica]KDB01746.1 4Fe-4S ferredoxin [Defluviimonas sp. 20V17]GHE02510.1 ferredoxin [Allgaiera indica]SDX28764.1 4Fe-4S binding domain-containing protein [Allgaiera indica]